MNSFDDTGATPLHYAAFGGHRRVVRLLLDRGAYINSRDAKFHATPAGWAIEYLRERGGLLGIELRDFAYAIRSSDVRWVERFLLRFPHLRDEKDEDGTPFRELARASTDPGIAKLFDEYRDEDPLG